MWKRRRRRRENKTSEYPTNLFELVTAFGYTMFEERKAEIQSTIVITLLNGVRSIIRNIQQTKSLSGETKGDSYRLFKLYGKDLGAHDGEARRMSASGRLYLEPALRSWVSRGEDTVMPVASPLDATEY